MTANSKKTGTPTKQPSRIMLGTHADISGAGKLCQRLKKCAAKGTDVNLYAEKVQTIDTVTLQLLLSFVRQVRANGNEVTWKSTSASLLKTAGVTGLKDQLLLGEPRTE